MSDVFPFLYVMNVSCVEEKNEMDVSLKAQGSVWELEPAVAHRHLGPH